MHHLNQSFDVLDRRLGQHAVPQIENMAPATIYLRQDLARLCFDNVGCREQDGGIEIALQRDLAEAVPRFNQRHAPIYADHNLP
jgi:hypothetical protein